MSEKEPMKRHPAYFTFDEEAARAGLGRLYYFAPVHRASPPYRKQIHVEAIIDIANDGTLAGVELIERMPLPPRADVPNGPNEYRTKTRTE